MIRHTNKPIADTYTVTFEDDLTGDKGPISLDCVYIN